MEMWPWICAAAGFVGFFAILMGGFLPILERSDAKKREEEVRRRAAQSSDGDDKP